MSTFIKIPGVNPPSTRPRVDLPDGLMPDKGALLLLDVMHPTAPIVGGVPVNGQLFTNLAAGDLKAQISAPDEQLHSTFELTDLDNAKIQVKRTAQRGINATKTEAGTVGGVKGFRVTYPLAVMKHVIAKPTHAYYFSLWMRVNANTDGTHAWSALSASNVRGEKEGYVYIISNANTNYPNNVEKIGSKRVPNITRNVLPTYPAEPLPYPFFGSVGVSSYANPAGIDLTAEQAQNTSRVFGVGAWQPFGMPMTEIVGATFYRGYMEDLTVSGRSYAEVEAIDYALYQKEVMTRGGRYYGDTA